MDQVFLIFLVFFSCLWLFLGLFQELGHLGSFSLLVVFDILGSPLFWNALPGLRDWEVHSSALLDVVLDNFTDEVADSLLDHLEAECSIIWCLFSLTQSLNEPVVNVFAAVLVLDAVDHLLETFSANIPLRFEGLALPLQHEATVIHNVVKCIEHLLGVIETKVLVTVLENLGQNHMV